MELDPGNPLGMHHAPVVQCCVGSVLGGPPAVARKRLAAASDGGLGHQQVEIVHEAEGRIGPQAVQEADRTLQRHRNDADPVERRRHRGELAAQATVPLRGGGEHRVEIVLELARNQITQRRVAQGGPECRCQQMHARQRHEARPVDRRRGHGGHERRVGLAPADRERDQTAEQVERALAGHRPSRRRTAVTASAPSP